MTALPLMLGALCSAAIGYRYYSAFIAARVLALDDRPTPAHRLNDGHNYVPMKRLVLFGHHFAAISGAGPLVGPVLAAQFGYLPGYLWIIVGVVLGGAVHDFVMLAGSVRHDGKSLVEIVRAEVGPKSGAVAGLAVFFILTLAIAAMAKVVVTTLAESAWGTFTIACTIPIAIAMGVFMRRGKTLPASLAGVALLVGAVILGRTVATSSYASWFLFSETQLTIAVCIYGFAASILPVWLLLLPRDYLSSYMKLGTIALLIAGICIVNPELKAPAISQFSGGGPIVPGSIFPFVFITIACGAISGFHGLIGSGTTPKMLDHERDARFIGYGAMLMESLVAIVALIAAASLSPGDYFAINLSPEKFKALGMEVTDLPALANLIGERLTARSGGAVSLAVGMSQIFARLPKLDTLIGYWYHFAIMFEALFILTTVDSGTRVARFLVQELFGRRWPALAKTDSRTGALLATTLVVSCWGYLVFTGSVQTLWPMLGLSNQTLACIALIAITTWFFNTGRKRYAWVTLGPLLFVGAATQTAGYELVTRQFIPKMIGSGKPELVTTGWLLTLLAITIMLSFFWMLVAGGTRWFAVWKEEK